MQKNFYQKLGIFSINHHESAPRRTSYSQAKKINSIKTFISLCCSIFTFSLPIQQTLHILNFFYSIISDALSRLVETHSNHSQVLAESWWEKYCWANAKKGAVNAVECQPYIPISSIRLWHSHNHKYLEDFYSISSMKTGTYLKNWYFVAVPHFILGAAANRKKSNSNAVWCFISLCLCNHYNTIEKLYRKNEIYFL